MKRYLYIQAYCLVLIFLSHSSDILGVTGGDDKSHLLLKDQEQADLLLSKARSFESGYQYDSAIYYYQSAFTVYLSLKMWEASVQCLNSISEKNRWIGKGEEAFKYAFEALDISNKHLDINNIFKGCSYYHLGTAYVVSGWYEEAILYLNKAIKIWDNNKDITYEYIPKTYANLGIIYHKRLDLDLALSYYNNALLIFQSYEAPEYELALLYSNMGVIYENMEDFKKALEYHNLALQIRIETWGKDHPVSGISYHNIGAVYHAMEKYDLALKYFTDALNIFEDGNDSWTADTYNNMGNVYYAKNEFNKALKYYSRGLEKRLEIYTSIHPDVAQSYNNIGEVYFDLQEYEEAISYFHKAILSNSKASANEIIPTNILVDDVLSENQYYGSLINIARCYNELYESTNDIVLLHNAFHNYELAIELSDKIRFGYKTRNTKLIHRNEIAHIFEEIIRIAVELYSITNEPYYQNSAFYYAEKNKAVVLLDLINESIAKKYANIPDSLLNQEQDLLSNLSYYENQLALEQIKNYGWDTTLINKINERLPSLKIQHQKLIHYFEDNYPEYYQLKYKNEVMDVLSLQQYLSNNEIIIEYVLSDPDESEQRFLYVFLISPEDYYVFKEEIDSLFEINLEKYRNSLLGKNLYNHSMLDYCEFKAASHYLFTKLIGPCINMIQGEDLYIITDGVLGYIPFESLIMQNIDSDEIDYKNLPYLIRNHAISYGYSATLLTYASNEKKNKRKKKFLAMAPGMDNLTLRKYSDEDVELLELYGAKEEVQNIAGLLKGDCISGNEATKEVFLKLASQYRILHIASHGLINDNYPMQSKLLFYNDNDTIEESTLSTYELYSLKLDAQMAVLSACNTGIGKLQRGEGIISFARGFLYAGVPSITMTLWPVNDETSAKIMLSYYKYLLKGKSKSEALRMAKLDFLDETIEMYKLQPYYWAGYVVMGDNCRLYRPGYWKVFIVAGGILLIFFLIYIRIRS